MGAEGKGKMSLMAAGGFTVLGIVLTVAAMFIPTIRLFMFGRTAANAVTRQANIILKDGHKCDFWVYNNGQQFSHKFPVLKRRQGSTTGDNVTWKAWEGRSDHPGGTQLFFDLYFPSTATPFSSDHYYKNDTTVNENTNTSSDSSSKYGDYVYLKVTFTDGDFCSNATDPGVHVDQ